MKRLIPAMLFFSLIASTGPAEPLKIRLETSNGKSYSGALISRADGSIAFQPFGAETAVRVPDTQIAYVKFSVSDDDEEEANRLFDKGEYDQAAEKFQALLTPLLSYVTLPSNLTPATLHWMISCFWTWDYDRAQELSSLLAEVPDASITQKLRFYNGLILLAKGDSRVVEDALKNPEVEALYPEESAARLYIEARLLQKNGEYMPALRTAARLIAQHSTDSDWMPRAELLCAELYFQLQMPESAESVLADINQFYTDPNVLKKAAEIAAEK